jgi:threonine dehydrogenase-like Zn-dependent dehydrogenase
MPFVVDTAIIPATMTGLLWQDSALTLSPIVPTPTLAPNEALIAVDMAGICNTDLELIKGYMGFEGVLGHEFVGRVVQCPSNPELIGQRVCVDINAACDKALTMAHCDTCGHPHHCPSRTVIGIVNHSGGFAHFVKAPVRNLYPVPESVTNQQAVFCEPLAAAFEILEQVIIKPQTSVVVLGDGKLGLLIAMVLRLASENVLLAGRHPDKLALVEDLGIQTTLSQALTETKSADVVVEATGSPSGLAQAMALTKPRGTIVLKSTVAIGDSLNLAPIVVDELTVVGSRCGPFDKALEALAHCANRLPVERLIQAQYPLTQGVEAIKRAAQKGTLKILLNIDE